MTQIADRMRLALGDNAVNKVIEIKQFPSILFDHMREVQRLRMEFCVAAVTRHACFHHADDLASACAADNEYSESMDVLAHRMKGLGDAISTQTKELIDCFWEATKKIGALEADLRRAQARVKEHLISDPDVRQQVFNMTDGRCFYCEAELSFDGLTPGAEFNVDHVMPRASGGPDHLMNYVPACGPCNVSKNASHLVDFFKRRKHPHLKVVGGQE